MKITVLDGYTLNPGDLSWGNLETLGDVTVYDRTPEDKIIERIGDSDAIYTNKTPITNEILDACPSIKFIGVLATGYNIVNVNAAKERGIPVCNVPTYGTMAVSQFVFALLLEMCHHVWEHNLIVKKGDWTNNLDWCFWSYPLMELEGKTMGIIGYGKIGQATGKIAQAFGMKVLAFDKYQNKELESETMQYTDLNTLLQESDVISLHCPLFPDTEKIMNKQNIAKCKDGVIIINTSRGGLVVEEDMAEMLKRGKVLGFAADVVSTEPIKMDNLLLGAPNIILTPHIAWAPKESRERLLNIAINNLKSFITGKIINRVN